MFPNQNRQKVYLRKQKLKKLKQKKVQNKKKGIYRLKNRKQLWMKVKI